MSYKDEFLASLIRTDRTGFLPALHARLVENNLKFRASRNSETLLYYALDSQKKPVGLIAFRVLRGLTIFSFPATYWSPRRAIVDDALSAIPSTSIAPTGDTASSQYSMRQVIVSSGTVGTLLHVIDNVVSSHARMLR